MTDEWINSFESKLQQIRHERDALQEIFDSYHNGDHYEQLIATVAGETFTIVGLITDALSTLESVLLQIQQELEDKLSDANIFDACYRELVRRW